MKKYLRKLNQEEIEKLKQNRLERVMTYQENCIIFGDDKTQEEVALLIEGELEIMKNGEPALIVTPGYMLGINHLRCRAKRPSKALMFKRDEISP